ncbi:MAG: methyltransferase domain-containing protein [Pseudomonadales bacterium]
MTDQSPDTGSYYRDHWVHVEPERMSRYEAMFQWRDGHAALIAPADVRAGQVVVDYGCGPGGLSAELARRVGPGGRVLALDINPEFLDRTRALVRREGLDERVETHLLDGETIPLADASVDRVICKNVLEYVPDPARTVAEFRRLLRPGGIAHVSDSDWGAVIVEPLGAQFEVVMAAAAIAFRTPQIGRRLYGLFGQAGLDDVRVQMLASPDTEGALRPVLSNMAGYARTSGRLAEAEIAGFLAGVDAALEAGTYLAVLPQFLVTGRAPA